MTKLILVLSACVLVSCGSTVSVNGQPSEEYFAQFKYKQSPGELNPYHYLMTGLIPLLDASTEDQIYMVGDLFLLDENAFVFIYREIQGKEWIFEKKVEGAYQISDGKLLLPGLGSATGVKFNDKESVYLTFESDFNTQGVANRSEYLFYLASGKGLGES